MLSLILSFTKIRIQWQANFLHISDSISYFDTSIFLFSLLYFELGAYFFHQAIYFPICHLFIRKRVKYNSFSGIICIRNPNQSYKCRKKVIWRQSKRGASMTYIRTYSFLSLKSPKIHTFPNSDRWQKFSIIK